MTTDLAPTAIDAYVYIDSIRVLGRHRRDLGDVSSLAASILDLGLINPITVTEGSQLVAGERRLAACRSLGWDSIPVRIVRNLTEASQLLRAERDENTCRKDMLPSEKAALGAALEDIESAHAKERQRSHGGTAPGRPSDTSSPQGQSVPPGRTDEAVGDALGMHRTTYSELAFAHKTAHDPAAPDEERQLAREALADMDAGHGIKSAAANLRSELKARREAEEPDQPIDGDATREKKPVKTATRTVIMSATKQRRALTGACSNLSGIAHGLRLVEDLHPDITSEEAAQWVGDLSEARLALERVIKRLKERTNSGSQA